MHLQKITLQKINSFCGKEEIFSCLKRACTFANEDDRHYFEYTIIYMRCLFEIKVNLTQDVIDFKDYASKLIDVFSHYGKKLGCKVLTFFSELLKSNLDYTSTIKKIA